MEFHVIYRGKATLQDDASFLHFLEKNWTKAEPFSFKYVLQVAQNVTTLPDSASKAKNKLIFLIYCDKTEKDR